MEKENDSTVPISYKYIIYSNNTVVYQDGGAENKFLTI